MELAVVGLYSFLIAKQSRVSLSLHTKYAGAGDLTWN